jgi:hypothetical protein
VALSPVLDELARREQYLAMEAHGRRYPVDVRYGLLSAQLALALSGRDRDEVLTGLWNCWRSGPRRNRERRGLRCSRFEYSW